MKNLLRAAAIAVASSALVAGGAVTTGANAAPGDSASIAVQDATLNNYKNIATNSIPVVVTPSRPNLSVKATVVVNGVPVAAGVPVFSTFTYQQAWGHGVVQLTNFVDYSGQAVAGASNPFRVRFGVESRFDNIQIKKRGKKLTFKIKARYIAANGKPVGIRKATIQVKKGSKWKTLKNVNLKKNGTKTFKKSDKKKRQYRLVIKTTSLYTGGQTGKIKI